MLKFVPGYSERTESESSTGREKFIKSLLENEKRQKEEEKKKENAEIGKLKLKYSPYINDETSTDANVVKLNDRYDKTKIFQAGEQKEFLNIEHMNMLEKMGYNLSQVQIVGKKETQDIVQDSSTMSLKK